MKEFDEFKTIWQSNQFFTEEKEMNDIHKMIQKNTVTILGRIAKRYSHVITSSLIGTVLFVIFFYTISDGFRESPFGLVFGVVMMLSVTGIAWSRYQQLVALDYGSNLQERLRGLIAQRQRSLAVEQGIVIGAVSLMLGLSRLLNGRGFTALLQPDVLIGLALTLGFTVGLVYLIRHSYRSDIGELKILLNQLVAE